jgi:uncharacterized protein
MVSEDMIQVVTERLRRAAPDATIILFGSHARGDAHAGSDLDILVVEPEVASAHAEEVRLSDLLGDLLLEIDLLVASQAAFDKWSGESCTLMHEAARDGRVLSAPA